MSTTSKDIRYAWGHRFEWTPLHEEPEQYNHLKYTCDTLADKCLKVLNWRFPAPRAYANSSKVIPQTQKVHSTGHASTTEQLPAQPRDLFKLLEQHHESDADLRQLWQEVTTTPSWVDWDQIARGQDVFYRYGGATINGLAFQSLLGATGSSGRIAETLSRTGGFNPRVARKRLLETTQFVLQCTESLASIQPARGKSPSGAGFASALRVRLLHASVRSRILQMASARPEYFSVEQHGIPVNDLDCIGTILVFSASIMWLSLPRQGVFLHRQEEEDYLALWRLVAHYMGVPTDVFSEPAKAKAMMEALLLYEYDATSTSKTLAQNILRSIENQPPAYATRAFLEMNVRWLNGNELADALGFPPPSWYYLLLTSGQCLMYACFYQTIRLIPILDRYQIDSFRRTLWSVVVDNDLGGLGRLTVFDFKYLPSYGRTNALKNGGDDSAGERSQVFWTADRVSLIVVIVFSGLVVLTLCALMFLARRTSSLVVWS